MTHVRRSRLQGFTLIELMIALTVGGIAISSLYALGSASTRHFREQNRVSTTQSSLRAAMNQIKRDFQRAGFLGTPSVAVPTERCQTVGSPLHDTTGTAGRGQLAAISAYRKNVATAAGVLDPENLNAWATVDEVILMGNYSTSGEYMGVVVTGSGSVTIPNTSQSFRRDFTNWYPTGGNPAGSCNQTALTNAFAPNRLLRLHALDDRNAFAQVTSAVCSATGATINFNPALGTGCNITGGWVSPLNTIRYSVVPATTAAEISRIGANVVAQLRRTEVDPGNKANTLQIAEGGVNRDADNRVVLDYVVRFDVSFLMRTGLGVNTLNWVPATADEVRNNPERVRGAIIELAARTAEHEPDMDVSGSAVRFPPFRLRAGPGAARTRALRAELLLPNITVDRY